jgi:hypothetical protein
MNQDKRIVVLFEDGAVRREVIQYSVALSQRIGAQITLLMLLPNEKRVENREARENQGADPATRDPVDLGESILGREAGLITDAGVQVQYEVIRGEPRSEFIKFMATRPSFHTVVWGGDPQALRHAGGHQSEHWITTVGAELSCPLVTPARK